MPRWFVSVYGVLIRFCDVVYGGIRIIVARGVYVMLTVTCEGACRLLSYPVNAMSGNMTLRAVYDE